MAIGKTRTADNAQRLYEGTDTERELRRVANFESIEKQLIQRWPNRDISRRDKVFSRLGRNNPIAKRANPKDNLVWVLDNTAYRPVHDFPHDPQPWQAEFVACFFRTGRKDMGKFVTNLAQTMSLDNSHGDAETARKRIEERVQPFINAIAPARVLEIQIPNTSSEGTRQTLGPGNANGISSQTVLTGGGIDTDGTTITVTSAHDLFPTMAGRTRFAGPEGWAIISDIDDTMKMTNTMDPVGILRTTFADIPQTTSGMPEFFGILDKQFKNPAWFYLSASPYNLYPFLHEFVNTHYRPGTLILRDNSWMNLAGLLRSLTLGTQAYKMDRMEKIHSWLPKRTFICIGDSTQSDPEAYAAMYNKYPGWIEAIYIRKVTDAPDMVEKNHAERFRQAFTDVPQHAWRVFVEPDELADHVKHLAGEAHMSVVGELQAWFGRDEQALRKLDVKGKETAKEKATPVEAAEVV